jgi:hypothetical protein
MCPSLAIAVLLVATTGRPAPAQPAAAPPAAEEGAYVRKMRTAAVSAEVGVNSLAGLVGLKGTWFLTQQVAVDLGLGASVTGARPGVYGRYLFSDGTFAPFVYGGVKYGVGSGDEEIEVEDPDTGIPYHLKIKPSPFLDFGLGIDYLAHSGFYLTAGAGWSYLLRTRNHEWVGPKPPSDVDDVARFVLGSGLAFSLSLGYAF